MNNKFYFRNIISILILSCIISACSNVRYTYYSKRKVPFTPPEEVNYTKPFPSKPFLAQSEAKVRENSLEKKNEVPAKPVATNSVKTNAVSKPEPEKVSNEFDISKFFSEHKYIIKASEADGLDDRTMIIVLLVILILIVLALIGDGLLWLLWLALVVLLILALIKYLGLFS